MPVDMSPDMTLEVLSLAASLVSVIVGLIAVWLSVMFYIQGNRSNTAASQTLAEVKTLVNNIQQHAFGIVDQLITRITSAASPTTAEDNPDKPSATKGDGADGKQKSALDAEYDALNKLYAADMQLSNPMYGSLFGLMGGAPMVESERQRFVLLSPLSAQSWRKNTA
jgi:cytoskeletal protein RodZ